MDCYKSTFNQSSLADQFSFCFNESLSDTYFVNIDIYFENSKVLSQDVSPDISRVIVDGELIISDFWIN